MKKLNTKNSKKKSSKNIKRKSKRQNPNPDIEIINSLLINMIDDYVTIKTLITQHPRMMLIVPPNIDDSKIIAYGILKSDNPRFTGPLKNWYIQFNPLIQGKLHEDLGQLVELGLDDSVTQTHLFQNFEENYPPTFEFTFYTDNVYTINNHEICLSDDDTLNIKPFKIQARKL